MVVALKGREQTQSNVNERLLLRKIQDGDHRSINILLESYLPLIKSICSKLFSGQDREEYTQQAWLEAYELIKGYKNEYGVGAYLKQYLPKRLQNYRHHTSYPVRLTKHAITKFKEGLAPEIAGIIQPASSREIENQESSLDIPSETVERWEVSEQIQVVLGSLPDKPREVLTGLFIDHATTSELADHHNMSPQGVSILKKRTLKRLQQRPIVAQLAAEIPEIHDCVDDANTVNESAVEPLLKPQLDRKVSLFKSLLKESKESALYWMSTVVSNSKPMQLSQKEDFGSFPKLPKLHKLQPSTYLRLSTIPFAILALTHNVAWSIPSLLIANYFELRYLRYALKSISRKAAFVASSFAILGLSLYASPVFAQVEFSFLLGDTEEMLKTCYLSTNATVAFVIGALAASFRGIVMWKLGNEAFQYVEDKRNDQNGTGHLKNLGYGLLAFVIVGAFEPYLARPCAAGGAGGAGVPPAPPQ